MNGKSWPSDIKNGRYLDADALWQELFAQVEVDLAAQEAALVERRRCREAEFLLKRQAQAEEDAAQAKVREAAMAVAAEERRLSKERSEKRKEQLETLEVPSVEWDEWVDVKNKYGGKSQNKISQTAENCTLKFSGQRIYIQFSDGSEIIKLRRNVRWSVT